MDTSKEVLCQTVKTQVKYHIMRHFFLVFVMPLCVSVLFVPCGHLLTDLVDLVYDVFFVSLSLSPWYPGSEVVIDS